VNKKIAFEPIKSSVQEKNIQEQDIQSKTHPRVEHQTDSSHMQKKEKKKISAGA
jgi:hypothetical protein